MSAWSEAICSGVSVDAAVAPPVAPPVPLPVWPEVSVFELPVPPAVLGVDEMARDPSVPVPVLPVPELPVPELPVPPAPAPPAPPEPPEPPGEAELPEVLEDDWLKACDRAASSLATAAWSADTAC